MGNEERGKTHDGGHSSIAAGPPKLYDQGPGKFMEKFKLYEDKAILWALIIWWLVSIEPANRELQRITSVTRVS